MDFMEMETSRVRRDLHIQDISLLGVFSLSCSWVYKQVWWNEKFWVMYVTIYQTSQNCTHVHPGERREAHRKILTKILIMFIYIPSSLRQSTSISLYLKSFYKLRAASYSKLQAQKRERHLMTSMDMLFFPDIKLYHNIFALSNIVGSILLYLIVSCCVLLQLNLTQVHDDPKARNTYRNVKRHSSMPFPLLYWTILLKYVSTNHEIKRSSSLSRTSSLQYDAPAQRVDQNAEAHTLTSRDTLHLTVCYCLRSCWMSGACD